MRAGVCLALLLGGWAAPAWAGEDLPVASPTARGEWQLGKAWQVTPSTGVWWRGEHRGVAWQNPRWSSDGEWLAVWENYVAPGMYVVRRDGTGLRQLTQGQGGDYAWLPEAGARLVYSSTNQAGFGVYDAHTGSRTVIPAGRTGGLFTLSAQGSICVYDGEHVVVYDRTGRVRYDFVGDQQFNYDLPPFLSRDGARVWHAHGRLEAHAKYDLCEWTLATGAHRLLTHLDDTTAFWPWAISPRERYALGMIEHVEHSGPRSASFVGGTLAAGCVRLDTGLLTVMPDVSVTGNAQAWDPSETYFACRMRAGPSTDLFVADATGRKTQLTRTLAWENLASWSPNGKYVAFERDRDRVGREGTPHTIWVAPIRWIAK